MTATVFLIAVYIPVFLVLPPGGFFSGDQGVKYLQVDALAHTGTLSVGTIDELLSVFRPVFAGGFYREVGGSYQAVFSPAYAVVVLPFYLLLGMRGLVIPSVLGTLLTAFIGGRLAGVLGAKYPGLTILVVGLASPLVVYAFILWEHAAAVALVALAAYMALQSRYLSAGICSALAVWFRPEILLFALSIALAIPVACGLHYGIRRLVRFAGGFLLGIAPWWTYNFFLFGTVLGAQVEANQRNLATNRFAIISLHLLPVGQKKWVALIAATLLVLVVLRVLHRSMLPALMLFWLGVVGLSFANLGLSAKGVAPSVTDVFPFGFASLLCLSRPIKDSKVRFLWVLVGSYTLAVTLTTPTWGGSGWGPRMLLGVYAPLAALSWMSLDTGQGRLMKLIILALLFSSVVVQAAGLHSLYNQQNKWAQLNTELAALRPKVLATSIWWLPQVAAPTLRQMRWYGVVAEKDIEEVAAAEDDFWWIWTDESPDGSEQHRPLENAPSLPGICLREITTKALSVRGLQAVLYHFDCR